MKHLFFTCGLLLLLGLMLTSCNPKMHIVGSGMRYHNLSQNKYQPKKHRKQVRIGNYFRSPIFFIIGSR